MATKENNQKKLGGFLSKFYRSSAKSHKPKPPEVAALLMNSGKSKPVSWSLLLKKLENCQTTETTGRKSGTEREGVGGERKVVVEGKKSVSHVESNLSSVISFLQVKAFVSDMPGFMQVHAFRCARPSYDSWDKFSSRNMAYNMTKYIGVRVAYVCFFGHIQEFDKVH